MTDWADRIEARNYGLKNELDVHMLSELLRILFAFALVAGALLFYSWVRNQIVNTGYESQDLFAAEESLLRVQEGLTLEEETLMNPERIDTIARNDLGMIPLHPSQLIPPQFGDVERSISNQMAMADSKAGGLKRAVSMRRLGDYTN